MFSCADFCHDSAIQASLIALAAPKVQSFIRHSSFVTRHSPCARPRVFLTTEAQRNKGLPFSVRLYGEPAKTLRRFRLRRRSQRSPLWLKEFKSQVQSSASLTFVTTRPFESKLSWRSLLQKFKDSSSMFKVQRFKFNVTKLPRAALCVLCLA